MARHVMERNCKYKIWAWLSLGFWGHKAGQPRWGQSLEFINLRLCHQLQEAYGYIKVFKNKTEQNKKTPFKIFK